MWNTVLFDLDGTLTDSGEGITRSVQYALKKGFDIDVADPSELREFVGPPLKEMFMKYASLSVEEGERAVQIYRERYRVKGLYENRLYEGIPDHTYFYFTHSYCAVPEDARDVLTNTVHATTFPSSVAQGNVYGCQFHPEKSSKWGLKLLENFARIVTRAKEA